jgi:hypothetical protein
MVYIAQIKNFEFKLKFEFYYGYKMNQVALNTLKLLARFLISKHHPWQLAQNTLYDLSQASHRIPWVLDESHDFKTLFAFYTIIKHCNRMWVFMIRGQHVQNFIQFDE